MVFVSFLGFASLVWRLLILLYGIFTVHHTTWWVNSMICPVQPPSDKTNLILISNTMGICLIKLHFYFWWFAVAHGKSKLPYRFSMNTVFWFPLSNCLFASFYIRLKADFHFCMSNIEKQYRLHIILIYRSIQNISTCLYSIRIRRIEFYSKHENMNGT